MKGLSVCCWFFCLFCFVFFVCVCVFICVSVSGICVFVCECVRSCSQSIAVAVCEGRFGELHHSGAAFSDDFGSATQQLLGFCESLRQLFLPLHELWVALRTRPGQTNARQDKRHVAMFQNRAVKQQQPYLALQHKLLPSFDSQQDALFVFDVRLLHGHDLLHGQQILLQTKTASECEQS